MTIWSYPTRIRFGVGEIKELATEVLQLRTSRVLLVTDPGVLQAGLVAPVVSQLERANIAVSVFDSLEPNPVEADAERGAAADAAHHADVLVALGGGAPLDTAKLIAVRTRTSEDFQRLDDALGGDRLIPGDLPSVVAIPTTAGTGSEVGRAAVVTVKATGRKTVIFSPAMLPRVAILDPELTLGLPAAVTAATGYDALTHCLEAYAATGDHPMADGIALRGLELVAEALPVAYATGSDVLARGAMQKAAMMGAVAFQKGLGACHAMAHPLSSECGVHHGLANAICLPAVVEFNMEAARETYARVAPLFNGRRAEDLPDRLRRLREQLGLASSLAEVGVGPEKFPRLVELALQDASHHQNPRACAAEDFQRLFERCA